MSSSIASASCDRTYRRGQWTTRALVLLLVLVTWWLSTQHQDAIARLRVPSPEAVFASAQKLVTTGYAGARLGTHVLDSTRRVLEGFVFASMVGVMLGIAMGLMPRLDWFLNPIIQILRPIPPLAWIPFAILWFGLGDISKVFVAWLAVFTPALINTYTGIKNVDKTLVAAARVHGANSFRLVTDVALPSALPMVAAGLRLSLQVAWMAVVATELVGAKSGLGYVMMSAARDLESPMIVVAMACVALLGVTSTAILTLAERRLISWQ